MTVLEMLKMNQTNGNQDGNISLYLFGAFDPALHFLVQKSQQQKKEKNNELELCDLYFTLFMKRLEKITTINLVRV